MLLVISFKPAKHNMLLLIAFHIPKKSAINDSVWKLRNNT